MSKSRAKRANRRRGEAAHAVPPVQADAAPEQADPAPETIGPAGADVQDAGDAPAPASSEAAPASEVQEAPAAAPPAADAPAAEPARDAGPGGRPADEGITPEDAPPPPPPRPAPKLRLLRFDGGGTLEEKLGSALETVEQIAQPAASAAGVELKKAMAFLTGQLSGAEASNVARSVLSRLGQLVASAQAAPGGEVDDFGRDPALEARALAVLSFLYRSWFRVTVRDIGNVPAKGPAILVSNHSGVVPWDAAMLKCALAFDHPEKRVLRPLAENLLFHYPFLGTWLNRFGAVRACQENAEALLARGEAVAVFPEGIKGIGKSFRKRYRLQRFGRGGFVKLAMRTGAPVVPVAVVGAEESHPLLWRLVRPAHSSGLPYLPVTPTFPWLGAAGLVPLPSKWIVEFGEPMRLDAMGRADDELTIQRIAEDVRGDIQTRLDRLVGGRRSVFF